MSKLFIIGNGFDLAHSLPTSYECFHKFLIKEYGLKKEDELMLDDDIELEQDKDGISSPCKRATAKLFCGLVSKCEDFDLWSDVENDMGIFPYSECFGEGCLPEIDMDDEYDKQRNHAIYNAEDRASDIYSVLHDVEPILREWIESVGISKVNPELCFLSLFDSNNDLFFNFNYTRTLEEIYNCKNVCHIHGCVNNSDKLMFGHGNKDRNYDEDVTIPDSINVRITISDLHEIFRKNTINAIEKNYCFFEKLKHSNIDDIYIYGFSFSEVDLVYLEYILKRINKDHVKWHINCFVDNNDPQKKRCISN